ncbi:hypothetical protein L211DRAFT_144391 [Terfezia boudieri ATCC MYA-4762]|uniref:Uncharacterized protein n=1 Tax=Terfezia boudieri ATCC MYA-4762 TaxID=1051890 RepID=A0A3N4LU30_9PEZI|nr:hypothetical protein L211DRAFT_144391 [Terfezia boudieri ATCC MYA-4762]
MTSSTQKEKALEAGFVATRAPSTTGVISETENSGGSSSFDRIASSASSLSQALLRPTASEASSTVQASQQSKDQASLTTGRDSSRYYWEDASSASRRHVQSFRGLSDSMEFRSISVTSTASTNGEFQNFSNEFPHISSGTIFSEVTDPLHNPQPREDILQLLSSSTLTEAIWEPIPFSYLEENVPAEAFRPNLQDAQCSEFLASEDIVEFLSREGTVYTEEVWGNMLGLLQEARKEVERSKGKREGRSQNGNAIDKLKMVQGHLRSKL